MFITLTFEDTPDEIEHAARTLTLLKTDRSRPRTSPGNSGVNPNNEPAQQWWSALSKRIGPETRRMAEAAAEMSSLGVAGPRNCARHYPRNCSIMASERRPFD